MLLLKHGTVFTGDEILPETDVLIGEDGKIAGLGTDLRGDGSEIELRGAFVMPGLVDAHSHAGGTTNTPYTDDINELTDPMTPELSSRDGVHWRSGVFDTLLRDGITASCIVPGSGNVIGGTGIVAKSKAVKGHDRVIRDPAVLKAAAGLNPKSVYAAKGIAPMTRMRLSQMQRDFFRRAREYGEKKREAEKTGTTPPQKDMGLENGLLVLEKKIPLKVHAYNQDMLFILDVAREFDFLVTMDHAAGASDYVEELRDPHVAGVIFGPMMMGLACGEACKSDYECLPLLDEAGVLTAVMTDGPIVVGETLIHQVGEAVRMGMPHQRALRMVTSNAARILGVEDRVGSLAPGMDADLCVFSHAPGLSVLAQNQMTVQDGRILYCAPGLGVSEKVRTQWQNI